MCDRGIEISSMVFFINLVYILSNPWLLFALSFLAIFIMSGAQLG